MGPILRESKEAAKNFPYHPWTGIFTYMWLIFYGFHVGKSTVRPMDDMGMVILRRGGTDFRPLKKTVSETIRHRWYLGI